MRVIFSKKKDSVSRDLKRTAHCTLRGKNGPLALDGFKITQLITSTCFLNDSEQKVKTRKNIEKKNFTKGGPYVNWPISVIFHEIPNPWKSLNRPSPVYSFKRSRNMSAMIVSVRFLWIWGFFRFFGLIFDHFLTKNSHFQNFFSKNGRKSIFFYPKSMKMALSANHNIIRNH